MGPLVPEICPESGGGAIKNKKKKLVLNFGRVHFATIGGNAYQQIKCPWPQENTFYVYGINQISGWRQTLLRI